MSGPGSGGSAGSRLDYDDRLSVAIALPYRKTIAFRNANVGQQIDQPARLDVQGENEADVGRRRRRRSALGNGFGYHY
jgi:hypothetical protein